MILTFVFFFINFISSPYFTCPEEILNSNSRGIVISMGPFKSHFTGAYSTIKSIRENFNCSLPIQIWAYVDEIDRFPPSILQAFHEIPDVSIHSLPKPTVIHMPPWDVSKDWYKDYIGFSSMARAIWTTSFEEVMAIDIDTVLFASPNDIFNCNQFLETGTLFLIDKFLDWWPHYYPPFDSQWLHQFMKTYDGNFTHISHDSRKTVSYFDRVEFQLFFKSGSQHFAESSLVLFDKKKHKRTMVS